MFGGLEYLTLLSDLISRGTDRYYAVIGQIVNPLRSVEKILVIWYGLFYRPQATEDCLHTCLESGVIPISMQWYALTPIISSRGLTCDNVRNRE
jgi:hypothetical protein